VPRLRAVLEVRHPSWLEPAVLDRLRDANVALCLADWRECPVTDVVTADFVYLRRHGWGQRYGGLYRERHLAADAADVAAWRRRSLDVYVYYNNDGEGAAITNALRLRELTASDRTPPSCRHRNTARPSRRVRGGEAPPERRRGASGRRECRGRLVRHLVCILKFDSLVAPPGAPAPRHTGKDLSRCP